ncbi:oligopeptide ABC transporter permease [Xylocopilactobacillus apis]|uniref:Peptide ABC transporter permease n=1 Tax=Xylocopilactobacillus apis TaxID=2932183 RepID=A0AAU9DJQ3_9LACO|nr:oligopeptide ABC transporter permease [Xylocopilactobacillus apis]BDR55639.1 peptide ABC transporter permease [Xylocopilactobacillus apis]
MVKYIFKRIGYMIITMYIIITITFFLLKLMPGSPYANADKLTASQVHILNQQFGLNDPIWLQYFKYLVNVFHGNFGTSFQFSDQPVSQLIFSRLGPTMQLTFQALIIGTFIGIILGTISAIHRKTWIDTTATFFAILGRSVPNFVFAVILQFFLADKWHLLPAALWNGFSYSILPTLALAMAPLANTARFMRSEMVEILHSDYIELAKAKGDSSWELIKNHALRNSMVPIITVTGPMIVDLMTGSMVVENIFSVPGIGEQFVKSITTNDYPTIMGLTILYSSILIFVTFIIDILYVFIDPRISLETGENYETI